MSSVSEARANLQRAEEDEKQRRRAKLIEQLAEVHAARLKAEADYLKLPHKIKAEREARARIQSKINQAVERLSESQNRIPKFTPYLPDSPEVVAWRANHQALLAAHAKLIEQANRSQPTNIVEAVYFEGPTGKIQTLIYAENNLLAALDPESKRKWMEGGIYAVG